MGRHLRKTGLLLTVLLAFVLRTWGEETLIFKSLNWGNKEGVYSISRVDVDQTKILKAPPVNVLVGDEVAMFISLEKPWQEVTEVKIGSKTYAKLDTDKNSSYYNAWRFKMPNEDVTVEVTVRDRTATKKFSWKDVAGKYSLTAAKADGTPITSGSDIIIGTEIILTVTVTEANKEVEKFGETTAEGNWNPVPSTELGENKWRIYMPDTDTKLEVALQDLIPTHQFTFESKEGYQVTVYRKGGEKPLTSPVNLKPGVNVFVYITLPEGKWLFEGGVTLTPELYIRSLGNEGNVHSYKFTMGDKDITLNVAPVDKPAGHHIFMNNPKNEDLDAYMKRKFTSDGQEIYLGSNTWIEKGKKIKVEIERDISVEPYQVIEKLTLNGKESGAFTFKADDTKDESDPSKLKYVDYNGNPTKWIVEFDMPDEDVKINMTLREVPKDKKELSWDNEKEKCTITVNSGEDGKPINSGDKVTQDDRLLIRCVPFSLKKIVEKLELVNKEDESDKTEEGRLDNGVYKRFMMKEDCKIKVTLKDRPDEDAHYRKFAWGDIADQYTVKVETKKEETDTKLKPVASANEKILVGNYVVLTIKTQGKAAVKGLVPRSVMVDGVKAADMKKLPEADKWQFQMPEQDTKLTVVLGDPTPHKLTFPALNGFSLEVTNGNDNQPIANESQVVGGTPLKIKVTVTAQNKAVKLVKLGEFVAKKVGKDLYEVNMLHQDAVLEVELVDTHALKFQQEGVEFTVTADGEPVAKSGDQVAEGAKLLITAKVTDETQESSQVKVNDEVAPPKGNDTYEFTMPKKDAEIKAALKKKEHELTIVDGGVKLSVKNGTTVVKNGNTVPNGAVLTIEIVGEPPSGKEFEKLTFGNETLEKLSDGKYTVTMPNKPETLTLHLKTVNLNTIKVTDGGAEVKIMDGATEVKAKTKVKEGTKLVVTVSVPANLNKEIEWVKFNGEECLAVNAEKTEYHVTMSATAATLEVRLRVKGSGTDVENLIKVTDGGATVKIKAGGVDVKPDTKVKKGISLEITVTPPKKKQIKSVTLNGAPLTAEADKVTYKAKMPETEATLVVELEDVPLKSNLITVTDGGATVKIMAGTTEVKSDTKVTEETALVITVTVPAALDKEIDWVKFNGEECLAVNPEKTEYHATMPATPATLEVKLRAKGSGTDVENLIKVTDGGATVKIKAGGVDVKPDTKVKKGIALEITVTPPQKKLIKSVTLNGTPLTAEADKVTYKAKMPETEATLVVVLEDEPLKANLITVTNGGATVKIMAGANEVKSDTKVPEGTALVITVTPPDKKEIASVTFNGTALTAEADKVTYKTTMSATQATLVVTLKDKKPEAVEDLLFAEVVVAPNPFAEQLRIVGNGVSGTYALLNANGQVVATGIFDASETMVATSDLPSGFYFLRLSAEGVAKTVKVVKK
ncbi:MAG: T9SS type A sorting domain-containing protein [Bacteroides sp.]